MFGDDILKSIGIILMVIFISFIIMKSLNLQLNFMNKTIEGMTDGVNGGTTITETKNSKSDSVGGIAGNAAGFDAGIKSAVTNMKDKLLFSKYKATYEDIIINYEEYISLMMTQVLLSTKIKDTPENMMENIKKIVALDAAKNALNNVMKYIDTQ
jgi:hypothetical protein